MDSDTVIPTGESETSPLINKKQKTPLPKFQLLVLLCIQLVEPLTSHIIYPFINKLVGELPITGGDEAKIGYYAGLIESLFFVTEALTVLHWSRWSDRIGRRPILLSGLFGLSLSMIFFGLSRSYWSLVISRCLAGLLNGNSGVIMTMVGELTDSTNIAEGMALMPIVWSTGATAGPIIGGMLSDPARRFPGTFGRLEFWQTYPYALPCFVVAGLCLSTFALTFFCLDETVRSEKAQGNVVHGNTSESLPSEDRVGYSNSIDPSPALRGILTPRVITIIVNYSLLALLDISLRALQPLFFTTRILNGGLGFNPPTVGLCLGVFGLFSGAYQALVFPMVYDWLGAKTIFVTSVATFIPMFALFPCMNVSARHGGVNGITWFELALQIILYVIMDMGFSCAFIYIRAAAPSEKDLGATNGVAQTSISVMRAIGPVAATSLFALSLEKSLLGGWLVYYLLITVSCFGLVATSWLPRKMWDIE